MDKIYGDAEVENFTRGIKELLLHLYDVYNALDTSHCVQTSYGVQSLDGMDVEKEKSEHGLLAEYKKFQEKSGCIEVKDEVDSYLLEANEDPCNDKFDILDWWKLNATKYPNLTCIARDVFAIPISTVASEYAFSSVKRILDPFRCALSPTMVQALICTKDWLQSSVESDDY